MKKLLALLLAVVMVFAVVACGKKDETPADQKPQEQGGDNNNNNTTVTYVRAEDEDVYEAVLGEYETMIQAAKAATSIDERFVLFAKAEAFLLDSAVMVPTTTQGGAYAISRIAPHTVPYVQWGNDDDRVKSVVIADKFITKEDRAALLEQWAAACAGEGTYDPAAYLTSHGYSLQNEYKVTFQTAPVTLDWLNTSSQADTEITVNTVDGLVEYNNLNQMQPALATSWDISEDGLTYTFHIREGVKWYTASGTVYAELTAKDFEAGFQHMLDAEAGLEWLVDGVVAGVGDKVDEEGNVIQSGYLYGGEWANVGYKATDKYTLTVTLEQPTSYFMTMLTYSCFLPICDSFYQSRGGVYGREAYKEATAKDDDGNLVSTTYKYGLNTDVASQVYCGAFRITTFTDESEIVLVKNENYYNADKVTMNKLSWVFFDGKNYDKLFDDTKSGVYPSTSLSQSTGTLKRAQEEKLEGDDQYIFDKYSYISDTNSTTFFAGLNLNRGAFALKSGAVASTKTEQQKIDTFNAMQNKNFRQAIAFAFDRAKWNAVSRGEDLKATNLRNMYTHPQFVSLSGEVTVDGKTWGAGTFYGEIVQYYLEQMGSHIQVDDQIDGWFNADAAKAALAKAVEELGDTVGYPIVLDVVYQSNDADVTASAQAFKQIIEETIGDKVVINLVEATTKADYYYSGYRASNGEAGNFDIFYGSGWGPDYGDPSSYLDTFLGYGAGYMTKVIGLF